MKPKRTLSALAAIGASLFLPSLAQGQTFTWDGGGGDDNFGTGLNWAGDTAPSTGSAVVLGFSGGSRLTPYNNYTAGDDFGEWRLRNTATGDFTITGNAFGLYGKIENDAGSGRSLTINTAGIYARDGSIEINPVGGNIVIGAAVELNGNASLNVYDGSLGRTLTLNGVLSNGDGTGGNGSLVVNQTSTVILAADGNDYGSTTINSGTKLQVGNGGATGSLGSGGITNNGQLWFNRTVDLTVSNAISGSGSLTKQGANVLTLSGASSYSGATAINGGTVQISAENNLGATPGSFVANQLTLNGGALKFTGGYSISANRGITIGAGGATLDTTGAGTNTQATIAAPITGSGPLVLKAAGNMGAGGGGRTTLSSTTSDFTGAITVQSGLVEWNTDASFGNTANLITLKAGGGLISTATGKSLPSTRAIALDAGTGTAYLRLWSSATLAINAGITGTGNLDHVDGGTLTLAGNNSFAGNMTNSAGLLILSGVNTYSGYTHISGSSSIRLDASNVMIHSHPTDK
jgi:fibronectin-binding autotransporter adhesin